MAAKPRTRRPRPTATRTAPTRTARKPRAKARRGLLVAFGGASAVGMFCLAGCTAVLAGAAAGMLASSAGSGGATISTPTVGDTVDSAADAAGAVLARTIKEAVPKSVRTVPAGKPTIAVAKPAPLPVPTPVPVPTTLPKPGSLPAPAPVVTPAPFAQPAATPAEQEDDGAEGR